MSGTSAADWFYFLAIVIAPVIFLGAMAYAVIRARRGRRLSPPHQSADKEELPIRGTTFRPGPPD